jgi:hypothetical protein
MPVRSLPEIVTSSLKKYSSEVIIDGDLTYAY